MKLLDNINLTEIEVKVWDEKDINALIPEIKTIARLETTLKSHIKAEKKKFNDFIKDYLELDKRLALIVNEFKNKVIEKIKEGDGFKKWTKIDDLTGEIKTKFYKQFPASFGILNERTKFTINPDFKFPGKYYTKILDKQKILADIDNLPKKAFILETTPKKISWLPKNILKEDKNETTKNI